MSGILITQFVGLALALVLAVRALRSRRMDTRRMGLMAATWIVIIVVLTFMITALDHS